MVKLNKFYGIALLALFASCASPKRSIYFYTNDKESQKTEIVESQPRPELVVDVDDIVAITVSSGDAITLADPLGIFKDGGVPYNITAQTGGGVVRGYLVNANGEIEFPLIGQVKIAGLTPTEIKSLMAQKLVKYVKPPIGIEVRLLNYKINMLGEVGRVGPILAPNHKINILEAITAAGDIPPTGRKDKVLIIREKNGKQEFGHINLNSKAMFTSPYYYLQKNDIVYVEPNRLKRQQNNEFLQFYLPTVMGLLSSALSIYGIVQITKNSK